MSNVEEWKRRRKATQTSVTKKAWKPYGTLLGNSTTATGSADIVFASMTCTNDFLQFCDLNSVSKQL